MKGKNEKATEALCVRVKEKAEQEGITVSVSALRKLIDLYEEEKVAPLLKGNPMTIPGVAEVTVALRTAMMKTKNARPSLFMTATIHEPMRKKLIEAYLSDKNALKKVTNGNMLTTQEVLYLMQKFDIALPTK